MKLECSIEKIKKALSQVNRITGKNLTLPILSSVLIIASKKLFKLRATNLSLGIEIEIPANIEKEGISVIKGDLLNNIFLNIYNDIKVSIEVIKDNLYIKTKNNKIFIKNYPNEDFPTIPIISGESFTIKSTDLIEGIKSVYYSASLSDIKPEISSIYIYPEENNLVFVATDSFRLAEKKIKTKKTEDFTGVIIPFKNTVEILKLFNETEGEIKVCFNKNQISFSHNGIYLTSKLIDGIFPDYKQIIPKNKNTEAITLKQDLLNALKLSNIFADKFNQINLNINPKKNIFELTSKNIDVGENKTKIEANTKGDDININFNHKYLLDCFQSIYQDSVSLQFDQENKPIIIRGARDNSFTYLIMPMNK